MKRRLSLITLCVLFAWALSYLLMHRGDLKIFWQLKPAYILAMLLTGTGHFMISGCFNRIIVKSASIKIQIRELCGLAVLSCIGNYVLPLRGGMGLRALYLKKKYRFPYSCFTSGTAGIYLVFFLVNSLLGLFSLLLLYHSRMIFSSTLVFLFAGVFCLVLLPFLLPAEALHQKFQAESGKNFHVPVQEGLPGFWSHSLERLLKFIAHSLAGWLQLKENLASILQLTALTLLNSALNVILLYFGFLSSSITPDITGLLMIASLLSVSGLVSLVPGGIGIQEAAIIFPSRILGISTTQSLMASLFVRSVHLFLAFMLLPFFRKYFVNWHLFSSEAGASQPNSG